MRGFLVEDVVIKTRRIKLRNLFEFSRLLNVGKVEVEMMWRRACCTVDRYDEPQRRECREQRAAALEAIPIGLLR
jgi:hypothetical protein